MSDPTGSPLGGDLDAALLEAVVAMASDRELPEVLERIVETARALTGARYAALGVLSETAKLLGGRRLAEFHTSGIAAEVRDRIGALPEGHGVLGVVVDHPEPLRLHRIADHPASVGFPPEHPPMECFLGVPIRVRTAVFGNLYLTDKLDGSDFDDADAEVAAALALAAGVAIENARLFAESRDHQRWLGAAAQLVPELIKDLGQAPTLVARTLVQTGDCDAAGIALAESDRLDGLVSGASDGLVIRRVAGEDLGLVGKIIDDPGRARVLGGSEQQRVLGLERGLSVVVACRAADRVLGALVLHRTWGGWSAAELTMIDTFADDIGRAVDHARNQHNWQLLAVYTERDRIARDLHDRVIQRIFAVGLGLEGALRRITESALRERIDGYVGDLDATIAEIRTTIFSLHRTGEERDSLRRAVLAVAQDATTMLGFEPRVSLVGPLDTAVPEGLRAEALATLREGLSNAARHARAHDVDVRVEADLTAGFLTVQIEDDGVGLRPDRPTSGPGRGLANLATRAATAGGELSLEDRAGGGTVLIWRARLTT